MEDGIYFDLPEASYHKIERLSASGIQNMLISPATFWAKSWMNPDRDDSDKPFQVIGRAYHTARFEPDQFEERFVVQLTPDDMPEGSLLTDAEYKARLKDLGEPQTKAGEKVLERADRLEQALKAWALANDADPADRPQLWHIAEHEWQQTVGERAVISRSVFDDITRDAKRLRAMPEVAQLLTGGAAEVTVLWTDRATGVQMKCRFDYLRPSGYTDFKTFENGRGKNLSQAITDAFMYNRYYIQAALYWYAAELIRSGELNVIGEHSKEQAALIAEIELRSAYMVPWYVFQEKGGVPNIIARRIELMPMHRSLEAAATDDETADQVRAQFGEPSKLLVKANAEIQWAVRNFKNNADIFGTTGEPWFPTDPLGLIEDDDFSPYWLES